MTPALNLEILDLRHFSASNLKPVLGAGGGPGLESAFAMGLSCLRQPAAAVPGFPPSTGVCGDRKRPHLWLCLLCLRKRKSPGWGRIRDAVGEQSAINRGRRAQPAGTHDRVVTTFSRSGPN